MRSTRISLAVLLLSGGLLVGACSSDDSGKADGSAKPTTATAAQGDTDVEAALEATAPDGSVEVPSADGATTIADYSQGSSGFEPADPDELSQILALVGTDADGYITDDAVVVNASEADASLWCKTAEQLGIDTYTLIPVRPDASGVDCG